MKAGESLGEWEDDLDAGNVIVNTWSSLGKKTYCFHQRDGDGKVTLGKFRLKGFALSAKVQEKINHASMSQLVKESLDARKAGAAMPTIQADAQSQITRNKVAAQMTTTLETNAKRLQLVYDAGTVVEYGDGDVKTVPFGYEA